MNARPTLLRTTQAFVVLAALALGMAPAFAVHDDGVFDIDGDVLAPGSADDWQRLFTFPGGADSNQGAASDRSFVTDPAPLSIFTGGLTKDNRDLNQWRFKDGSVPDKDNLIEAFAAAYSNGSERIYFGASRFANNGDAQIGFWFFQNVVKLGSDGTFVNGSGNPATHAVGDILVLSDFTQGGTQSNIQVLKVTAVNADGTVSLQTLAAGAAGTTLVCDADAACAATNGTATDSLDPAYKDKFDTPAGTYPPVVFFEGGLNLSALGLAGECFPNFLVETRSSQSIDAVLKDFTLKEFQRCAADIRTEVHNGLHQDITDTTVAANTEIHDKAIVEGTIGFPTPTGTVTFNFFTNDTCAGTPGSTEGKTLAEETPPTATTAGVAAAESTPFTPLPGSYSFNATYGGDSNYPDQITSPCEPFAVSRFGSAVNTRILRVSDGADITDQAINLMNAASVAVQDEATVVGAVGGPIPTGTVTFMRFGSGNCSGTAATETITLDGTGQALSSVFNLGPDTLSYTVIYNGDSNYDASAVSKCEPVCALNFTSSQP